MTSRLIALADPLFAIEGLLSMRPVDHVVQRRAQELRRTTLPDVASIT